MAAQSVQSIRQPIKQSFQHTQAAARALIADIYAGVYVYIGTVR